MRLELARATWTLPRRTLYTESVWRVTRPKVRAGGIDDRPRPSAPVPHRRAYLRQIFPRRPYSQIYKANVALLARIWRARDFATRSPAVGGDIWLLYDFSIIFVQVTLLPRRLALFRPFHRYSPRLNYLSRVRISPALPISIPAFVLAR